MTVASLVFAHPPIKPISVNAIGMTEKKKKKKKNSSLLLIIVQKNLLLVMAITRQAFSFKEVFRNSIPQNQVIKWSRDPSKTPPLAPSLVLSSSCLCANKPRLDGFAILYKCYSFK